MCKLPTEEQCVTLMKCDRQTMKPVIKVKYQGAKAGHTGLTFKRLFFLKSREIVALSQSEGRNVSMT